MENVKVGDLVWHPCSIDIMEHKVVGVHNYDGFTQVTTKSTHNIGACGKVECVLDVRKGKMVFVELVDEDDMEYSSGLQDFIKGEYYTNKLDARKAFYQIQHTTAWSNMDTKKRWYEDAKKRYEQVQNIIKEINEQLIEEE